MNLSDLSDSARRAIALTVGALALAGCAGQGSVRRLQTEVVNLRGSVGELSRQTEDASQGGTRLAETVRVLETRVDSLQAEVRRSGEEEAQLRRRLDAAESSVVQTRALVDALPRPAPTPSDREAAAPAETPSATAADHLYRTALAAFRSGEHGQAVLDFTDFLAKHGTHALAPDAQYWIAEAYYVQRDCRQAVVEYQKVLDYGASITRAPDALLKIGLCHVSLRDQGRAKQAWQRILRDYPAADAATSARSLLRARGVAGRP